MPLGAHAGILLLSLQQGGAASPAQGSVGRDLASPGAGKRGCWSLGTACGCCSWALSKQPGRRRRIKGLSRSASFSGDCAGCARAKSFLPDSSRLGDRCPGRVHPPPRTAATTRALSPCTRVGGRPVGCPGLHPQGKPPQSFWVRGATPGTEMCPVPCVPAPAGSVPSGTWCHPDTGPAAPLHCSPDPAARRWREKLWVKNKN